MVNYPNVSAMPNRAFGSPPVDPYGGTNPQNDRPITYGGMVPVASIEEVLKYPVQPGVCVHFKDMYNNYIYTKTQGFSQMERPVLEAYETTKVDFESLLPENKKLANFATLEQMNELTGVISQLAQQVADLKNTNTNRPKQHHNDQRRDNNGQR